MADGVASLPETRIPVSPAYYGSKKTNTDTKPRKTRLPFSTSSSTIQSRNQTSKKRCSKPCSSQSTISRDQKTRLPWLDGSRSRQNSSPAPPGAYKEDITLQNHNFPRLSTPTITSHDQQNVSGTPTNASTNDAAPTPINSTARAVESNPVPFASSDPRTDNSKTCDNSNPSDESNKPSRPLVSIARGLYDTDNTTHSESEDSMRDGRRKVLSEAATQQQPVSIRVQTENTTAPATTFAEDPSPKDPTQRKLSSVPPDNLPREQTLPTSSAADRQPSLSIQPIRQKKVTITSEDMTSGELGKRKQSLAVQPLRNRHASKSLEDMLSDVSAVPSEERNNSLLDPTEAKLRSSIAGLEVLMDEAVSLAKDAAARNRQDAVPAILDEARLAIHKASGAKDINHLHRKRHKSDNSSSSGSSALSFSSSSSSSLGSHSSGDIVFRRPSTAPKLHSFGHDGYSTAEHGSTKKPSSSLGGPQSIWDEEWPYHKIERLDPKAPKTVDFAYQNNNSSRPKVLNRGESSSTVNSRLPKLPQSPDQRPTVLSSSENVNYIRRPLPSKEEVHDHIRRRHHPPHFPRSSSLHYRRSSAVNVAAASDEGPEGNHHDMIAGDGPANSPLRKEVSPENWGRDKFDEKDYIKRNDTLKGRHHLTLKEGEHFSLHHGHRRQPIARNWSEVRKKLVALVACLNTALIGILIGIYAGEVPAIQYVLADTHHHVILGNVLLYTCMGITTAVFWPLPLLHGRKPYTLAALGFALPLQIPQAVIVEERRMPDQNYSGYMVGLLLSRACLGLALGFAHINFKATLLDLYGASLQSEFPHGEVVIMEDIRRHGGGMGYWLGIWSFSFIGSLGLGFLIGADVISSLNPSWGFWLCVVLIAVALLVNVVTPETRRSPHRRTMQEVELPNDGVSRRVARGEIRMHVSGEGPKWWWEEVGAGLYLSYRMLRQSGLLVMASYSAWVYAEIVLIIVLLGNLLSAGYRWRPEYVGLGVFAITVGALLAVPNSKANFFSRSRFEPPRTDSMTMQPRFAWTSHMARRFVFTIILPLAGMAYTLASGGRMTQFMVPIVFAAVIGYISNLAIAECNGIIMEVFDTCDLQPGTNSRHRLQSLAPNTKRKRTSYSSFPRVSAGLFMSQALGFFMAAVATGVGGVVTRKLGAQRATGITAGVLFGLTLLLTCVLIRFKAVQVVPNELFGSYFGSNDANDHRKSTATMESDKSWRAVIIGNPSGKYRRMNWIELGSLSRWTEIRRLNRLLNRTTTQGLNPGWQ